MNIAKNYETIGLPVQYSTYFQDKHAKVVYILVSIKLHIGNDMDSGHYICDMFY